LPAHDFGLIQAGQAFRTHKLSRFGQFLVDALEDRHVRVDVLLGPCKIGVDTCLRTSHQQNVFHVLYTPLNWVILAIVAALS
jgi:hypothetical protein